MAMKGAEILAALVAFILCSALGVSLVIWRAKKIRERKEENQREAALRDEHGNPK